MIGAEGARLGARVGAHVLVADANPYAMYTTITSNDNVDIAVPIQVRRSQPLYHWSTSAYNAKALM